MRSWVSAPVLSTEHARYERVFRDLETELRRDIERMLPDIRAVTHLPGIAIYYGARPDGAFEIRFQEDADGVWRLESM